MLITCKCLNVSMQLGKVKPRGVTLSTLRLSDKEKSHLFFSDAVAEIEEMVGVSLQVDCLVTSQIIDNWYIDSCINCALPFLARNKDTKQLPLISSGLISDPNTIQSLKNHKDFSPVYRIVLQPLDKLQLSFLGKQSAQIVKDALSQLQHKLGEVVQKEGAKTDERIRVYTEQQCQQLQKFRERANRDHDELVRLFFSIESKDEEPIKSAMMLENTAVLTTPTKAIPPSALSSLIRSTPRSKPTGIPGRRFSHRSQSLINRGGVAESYDAEGLFDLDGMVDSPPDLAASESDSDRDDSGSHDEGIDLRRKKSSPMTLAKSLPVNVPIGIGGNALHAVEIDEDFEENEDPQDIAASIKALARSVHGDAVFGDLPRPRFSTQI